MRDDHEKGATNAPFNMAIATLQRLHEILRLITFLDADEKPSIQKQAKKIYLVKSFFRNSAVLISDREKLKSFQKRLNNFEIRSGRIKGHLQNYFSEKLENELDIFLIDIQLEIAPYFMPSKNDPKYSWSQE